MALFHWQLAPHQHIMDYGKIYFKSQKSPYLHKMMPKSIVQAHGTTSHFQFMIQDHEFHWGNFGSRGWEGQEVCLVKLQRFKVDKGNMLLSMSSLIP